MMDPEPGRAQCPDPGTHGRRMRSSDQDTDAGDRRKEAGSHETRPGAPQGRMPRSPTSGSRSRYLSWPVRERPSREGGRGLESLGGQCASELLSRRVGDNELAAVLCARLAATGLALGDVPTPRSGAPRRIPPGDRLHEMRIPIDNPFVGIGGLRGARRMVAAWHLSREVGAEGVDGVDGSVGSVGRSSGGRHCATSAQVDDDDRQVATGSSTANDE